MVIIDNFSTGRREFLEDALAGTVLGWSKATYWNLLPWRMPSLGATGFFTSRPTPISATDWSIRV